MYTNIEQLKNDFLIYLNSLVLPSPESLIKKILPLQKTKLSKIKFKTNSETELSITDKTQSVIRLNKEDFKLYFFSMERFKKSIEAISNEDPEKLFSQAFKEAINLENKNLLKIYIPKAILAYTKLCEKLKSQNPEHSINKIYKSLDEIIYKQNESLEYNYFKRAYQGYENSKGFAFFFGLETENIDIIFNITKELKINFTPYKDAYINLINLIEQAYIQAKDKGPAKILVEQLNDNINSFFSKLMQKSFGKQNEKDTIRRFQSTTQQLIQDYIESHPEEYKKQRSILDHLLWFITKIIPESILSKDKKITLFGKYSESGRKFDQIIKTVKLVYKS